MVNGWARVGSIKPTLHVAPAAFYSPFPSDRLSFALTECKQSPAYSQKQEEIRANRKTDWINPGGLNTEYSKEQKAVSCLQVKLSGEITN